MKKRLFTVLAVILMTVFVIPTFTGCAPRNEILKVLNWGDYMDSKIYKKEFQNYYKEKTGKKITVKYSTVADNEKMYNKYTVATKPDYDLLCPSEYMIQQMMVEDMLAKLTRNDDGSYKYVTNFNNVFDNLQNVTYSTTVNNQKVTYAFDDYAVPYMWGTVGILYNVDHVTEAEVSTWTSLMAPSGTHEKKVSMKDSVRDAFFVAGVYHNRTQLAPLYNTPEHKTKLQEIVDDYSTTAIKNVENSLKAQRPKLYSYGADEGKGDMVAGKIHMGLMWSGDAVWGFDEDFNVKKNSKINLAYAVPNEGSNIWTDSFVIPKYSKNPEAAEIFLNFLLEKEVAQKNMIASGYTSAVEPACTEYRAELEKSDIWSSSKVTARGAEFAEWYKNMYLDTLFPTDKVIARCALMQYFGDANTAINLMWNEVRA